MQDEIEAEYPGIDVDLVHVNAAGLESGLPDLFAVTDLPVVQDDAVANVWTNWNAVWRDVWIVDATNAPVDVYNLTTHDLADPANYDTLKAMLVDAATP